MLQTMRPTRRLMAEENVGSVAMGAGTEGLQRQRGGQYFAFVCPVDHQKVLVPAKYCTPDGVIKPSARDIKGDNFYISGCGNVYCNRDDFDFDMGS